jgi:hypothetical protein
MDEALALGVSSLVVWRLTHFIVEEDGPGDVVARLRTQLGSSALGRLMDCFYCASVWTAAPLALVTARDAGSWTLHWLALSGAACLLERATTSGPGDRA